MHHQQLVTETGKSQLDVYLDESVLDFRCYAEMDVLQWWKSNNDRFPDLSILACDLLSVPIATVASDFEFCMGSRVFNKYKDRMLPMNVEARICIRSWLYNFVSEGNSVNYIYIYINVCACVCMCDCIVLITMGKFSY